MSFLNKLIKPKESPAPEGTRRRVTLLDRKAPPAVVNPSEITHAFIVITPEDKERHPTSKLLDAVFDLNKKYNPPLWIAALETGAADKIKYTWLHVPAGQNGYPDIGHPEAIADALRKIGLDSSSSLVLMMAQATVDGGATTSKLWLGFGFREQESRILCLDCDNKCIPPKGLIIIESQPGRRPKMWT